jgi:hypothetical protein
MKCVVGNIPLAGNLELPLLRCNSNAHASVIQYGLVSLTNHRQELLIERILLSFGLL